jgi:hypothetical protein
MKLRRETKRARTGFDHIVTKGVSLGAKLCCLTAFLLPSAMIGAKEVSAQPAIQEGEDMAQAQLYIITNVSEAVRALKRLSEDLNPIVALETAEKRSLKTATTLLKKELEKEVSTPGGFVGSEITPSQKIAIYMYAKKLQNHDETRTAGNELIDKIRIINASRLLIASLSEKTTGYTAEDRELLRFALNEGLTLLKEGNKERIEAIFPGKEKAELYSDLASIHEGDFAMGSIIRPYLIGLDKVMDKSDTSIDIIPIRVDAGFTVTPTGMSEKEQVVRFLGTTEQRVERSIEPPANLVVLIGDEGEAKKLAGSYIDGLYAESQGKTADAKRYGKEVARVFRENSGKILDDYCGGLGCRTQQQKQSAQAKLDEVLKKLEAGQISGGVEGLPNGPLKSELGNTKAQTVTVDVAKGSAFFFALDTAIVMKLDGLTEVEQWLSGRNADPKPLGLIITELGTAYYQSWLAYKETESVNGSVRSSASRTANVSQRLGVSASFAKGLGATVTVLGKLAVDNERSTIWFTPYLKPDVDSIARSLKVEGLFGVPALSLEFEGLELRTESLQKRVPGIRDWIRLRDADKRLIAPPEDIGISLFGSVSWSLGGGQTIRLIAAPVYSLTVGGDEYDAVHRYGVEGTLRYGGQYPEFQLAIDAKVAVTRVSTWLGIGMTGDVKDLVRAGLEIGAFKGTGGNLGTGLGTDLNFWVPALKATIGGRF